ncbi:hypothetical protein GCM10027517_11580 [Phycicoccus ginsengisoli]
MLVLGLILVVVAVAAGVLLFLATQSLTNPVTLDAAGFSVGMTPLALIIAGAVVLLVLWLGLALIRGSARRRVRPRREAKEAQRQAEIEENIRADERRRAEETHQQALAERDRVREQEFESRLAERDRLREDEYAGRRAEDESRIRADERTRMERELAGSGAQGAGAHGATVAGGGGAVAGAAAAHHHDHRDDEVRGNGGLDTGAQASDGGWDDSANERRALDTDRDPGGAGEAAASTTAEPTTATNSATTATSAGGTGAAREGEGADVRDGGTADTRAGEVGTHDAPQPEADGTEASDSSQEPGRHRTVADKIMGRGADDSTR